MLGIPDWFIQPDPGRPAALIMLDHLSSALSPKPVFWVHARQQCQS